MLVRNDIDRTLAKTRDRLNLAVLDARIAAKALTDALAGMGEALGVVTLLAPPEPAPDKRVAIDAGNEPDERASPRVHTNGDGKRTPLVSRGPSGIGGEFQREIDEREIDG